MTVGPVVLPELVASKPSFEDLVRDLALQPTIGVDTESNSLHAFRERVCLIQFSTLQRDVVVDPLALADVQDLGGVFSDPKIEKIFHAAEYDLICLRRDYGFSFANIFDTMQAGRILGRRQAGLDRLLEEKFGVKVSKRLQKADWGVRPLSKDLLLYAVIDTHYLNPLRDMLKSELQEKGRWELAQEDFRMACEGTEPKPRIESPSWTRLSARRDLTPRDRTVLKELVDWRESVAADMDRPPFKILDNDRMVEIARAQPGSKAALAELGLGPRQLEQWGAEILEAVQRGVGAPLVNSVPRTRPSSIYLRRLDKLKTWRKKTADLMDVESDVILPRGLLLALAERGREQLPEIMEPSPWRLQTFGDQINQVLQAIG